MSRPVTIVVDGELATIHVTSTLPLTDQAREQLAEHVRAIRRAKADGTFSPTTPASSLPT